MISGGDYSIYIQPGPATNASRVIVNPGAVFVSQIIGYQSVMELASTASKGTMAGFDGDSISNFASLTFDQGGQWTVTGDSGGDRWIAGHAAARRQSVVSGAAERRRHHDDRTQPSIADGWISFGGGDAPLDRRECADTAGVPGMLHAGRHHRGADDGPAATLSQWLAWWSGGGLSGEDYPGTPSTVSAFSRAVPTGCRPSSLSRAAGARRCPRPVERPRSACRGRCRSRCPFHRA
jgi:hypothetical protein